ncbi:MAG TPA: hypothetical protein VF107_15760, partial [Burkholderiaceae bacterium]
MRVKLGALDCAARTSTNHEEIGMRIMKICAALALGLSFAAGSQAQAIEKCHKSKWGANDQVGALNNVTPADTLNAAKLVKRGKAIRMGIETNSKTPAFPPRSFALTVL